MTPEQFCYWLRGHIELDKYNEEPPCASQWKMIKEHLDLVFKKVTPELEKESTEDQLKELFKDIGRNKKPKPDVFPDIMPMPNYPSPYQIPSHPMVPIFPDDNKWNSPYYPHSPIVTCSAKIDNTSDSK